VLVGVVAPRRDEAAGSVERSRARTRSVSHFGVSADREDAIVADGNGGMPIETQDVAVEDDQAGLRTVVVP